MITKYDTDDVVYVPVRIDKAFSAGIGILYTVKPVEEDDHEFELPLLEGMIYEENGKLIYDPNTDRVERRKEREKMLL